MGRVIGWDGREGLGRLVLGGCGGGGGGGFDVSIVSLDNVCLVCEEDESKKDSMCIRRTSKVRIDRRCVDI